MKYRLEEINTSGIRSVEVRKIEQIAETVEAEINFLK